MNTNRNILPGLPVYPDGDVADELFNVGQGLRDGRQLDCPTDTGLFKEGEVISDDTIRDRLIQLGGLCNLQYNEEGYIVVRYTHNNRLLTAMIQAGKVHVIFNDDYVQEPELPTWIRVVSNTSRIGFLSYIDSLKNSGLQLIYSNAIENNLFYEFQDKDRLINCSFNGNIRTARFIEDRCSVPVNQFGYKTEGTGTELYQYANNHQRMVFGYSCDCGMCYIVKLADNSIILIDGPEQEQSTQRNTDRLLHLLHQITHTKAGEPIRIAAWYCTHAHDDHMDMFSHIIKQYHKELLLERVMFNFPDTHQVPFLPQVYIMINRIRHYYPNVQYRKLHMGDKFQLSNVTIDVLSTHEQGVGLNGYDVRPNTNDTSTILKMSFENISFLPLGDIDSLGESILLKNLSEPTLHTNVIQASHHLINKLEHLYDVAHADYCLIPQSDKCRRPGVVDEEYNQIIRTVPYDNFAFAGVGTDGYRSKNGQLEHFYHEPLVKELYDGSII